MTSYLTYNQGKIILNKQRFRVVIAGRRFGKTEVAKHDIAENIQKDRNQQVLYIAPTFSMAREIMWNRVLSFFPSNWIKKYYESTPQRIIFKNGSVLKLYGGHKYDILRGGGYNHVVMDEVQDQEEEAWRNVIRPALSDTGGSALLIGTPKGVNTWVYDITQQPDFSYLSFTTLDGGIVPESEIENAKRMLDERTFRQEYLATFESTTGLVYYSFTKDNIKDIQFQPERETYLSFDFNPDPFCVTVMQNIENTEIKKYAVVKDFSLRNSNATDAGEYVLKWLYDNNFNGVLHITGDYTGINRSGYSSYTGWHILNNIFSNYENYYGQSEIRPTKRLQDSINALNSLLKSYDGTIRMFVNSECKGVIKDLQRVQYRQDGKLDDAAGKLTHLSDTMRHFAYKFEPVGEGVKTNL